VILKPSPRIWQTGRIMSLPTQEDEGRGARCSCRVGDSPYCGQDVGPEFHQASHSSRREDVVSYGLVRVTPMLGPGCFLDLLSNQEPGHASGHGQPNWTSTTLDSVTCPS
jgi:hypothetical protein